MHTTNRLQGRVLAAECPSRQILLNLTSRWGGLVLLALGDQTLRFSQLKQSIGGVSEKMLIQTLKALQQDGFVIRQVYAEVPPRVEYSLSEFGREAAQRFFHLSHWVEQSLPEILAQRELAKE